MNFSENEVHSLILRSENEHFARRCRHYKSKDSKAEWLPSRISWLKTRYGDRKIHKNGLEKMFLCRSVCIVITSLCLTRLNSLK